MIRFADNPGLWEPRESIKFTGYYHPPFETISAILFSRDGRVINKNNGCFIKTHLSTKGYVVCGIKNKGKYHICTVHRSVAVLFVPKPERHKNIPFDNLQVNHKDGNKANNCADNLEWVTGLENMAHARKNGLFSNDIKCRARNVTTGVVTIYQSISECARTHFIESGALSTHLKNKNAAGRIVANGHVYLPNNEQEWPKILMHRGEETSIGKTVDIVAKNVITNEVVLTSTFKGACDYLGFNFVHVRNRRTYYGIDKPYRDWVFYPLCDNID